ncbi:MAG: hypothetical protein ACREQ9_07150 [Candidatus Binatia bacterium]
MKRLATTLTLAALIASSGLATAAEGSSRVMELRTARMRVEQAAERTKGAAHQRLRLRERALDRLIADLENGRTVGAEVIDRALEGSEAGI